MLGPGSTAPGLVLQLKGMEKSAASLSLIRGLSNTCCIGFIPSQFLKIPHVGDLSQSSFEGFDFDEVVAVAVAGLGLSSSGRFRLDGHILIDDGGRRVAVDAGGLRFLGIVFRGAPRCLFFC